MMLNVELLQSHYHMRAPYVLDGIQDSMTNSDEPHWQFIRDGAFIALRYR